MPIPEPESFRFTVKNVGLIFGAFASIVTILKYIVVPRIKNGRNNEKPPFTETQETYHDMKCKIVRAEDLKEITKAITDSFREMSDRMDVRLGHVYDAINRKHND